MESFLFEMVGLDGEPWSADDALRRLTRAAQSLGHTVEEGEGIGDWRRLDLAGPLPTTTIMVSGPVLPAPRGRSGPGLPAPRGRSGPAPGWALNLDDGVLGDEEDPTDAQGILVDLLTACAGAVPLYLGTAVWPFGPETPPSYDTSGPFAAEQAGPVMYVSRAYAEEILGGTAPEPPKRWSTQPVGAGHLFVVAGNLLREPEDAAVRRLLKRLQPS